MIRLLLFLRRHAWPIAFVILIGIVILLGTILYWFPFRGAKAQTYTLERRLNEQEADRASLQKLYETLKGRFQKLESDRDNVLAQAKQLLIEKDAYVAAEAELKTLNAEREKLLEDHKKLEASFAAIQAQAKDLSRSLKTAQAESEARQAEALKITQERQDMVRDHSENTEKIQSLTQEVAHYKGYQESFMSLSQSFDVLQKERKFLEKKLEDLPTKFSEMARQNQILVKETGDMHFNLGVFYAGEMNYDRALEEFKKAVEINPNDAKAHYNLGYIYAEQRQDRKKAESHFRIYLGLTPDDPHADEVKSYLVERDVFTTNLLKT
ncbi:MAG: tetratricopeptide repeat protein [Candidatus Omnitrophota bacterium]